MHPSLILEYLACECSQLNWRLWDSADYIYILEYVWCNSFTKGFMNPEPGTRNLKIWLSFLPIFFLNSHFYPFLQKKAFLSFLKLYEYFWNFFSEPENLTKIFTHFWCKTHIFTHFCKKTLFPFFLKL